MIVLSSYESMTLEQYIDYIDAIIDGKLEYEKALIPYIEKNKEVTEKIKFDLKINKKLFNFIQSLETKKSINIISEPWCLDAMVLNPCLEALQLINPIINFNIYLRDKTPELMDMFLTNGSKSIPVLFELDSNSNEKWRWGARSTKAKEYAVSLKDESLDVKIEKMKNWYLEDKTMSAQEELYDILNQWK